VTEDRPKANQSTEELFATMNGQIKALTGLTIHLLCLSTLQVAVSRGDPNFERVAEDLEDAAREQTASVTQGEPPEVVTVAKRVQIDILECVRAQIKKEARILRVAAKNHRQRQ
jgi:hypothetical protein